ncbi:MAG: FAD-binding oxidoreductase [Myxococcota bacterium]
MSELIDALRAELGDRVHTDAETLDAHRHDSWALAELRELEGRGAPAPLAVVIPRSTEEVARALVVCRERKVALIPFGGGSGVCGGVEASADSVILSTRGLDGLVSLDAESLVASFRAGTLGSAAERRVQEAGLTIGHWPQSIELSTVGGWVATRASGQYSTAYGSIEDVVLGLEAVLPDGRILRTRTSPRASAGPELRQLFLGSEGTLGVVTEVTFSLRPLPEASVGQAFHFSSFGRGLEAVRQMLRVGWRPPVVRLYDARESRRQFRSWCPAERHLLILLHEGPAAAVQVQTDAVAGLCGSCGGEETDAAAVDSWLEHRNQVQGFRELFQGGLVVDTIELSCSWARAVPLYDSVTATLGEVPGMLSASAHSSHSYRSGTSLYFTFVARPDDAERMEETYLDCWRRVMGATVTLGASISHHHGIGRLRRDVLAAELGEAGVALLRGVKRGLDPDDLLNPGVLLPPARP